MSSNNKPITIGITGGIGSGKSTVCRILKNMSLPIYDADSQSKILCNTNSKLKFALTENFGTTIYDTQGNLDRQKFASIIFSNTELLNKANNIIHPIVSEDFQKWKLQQNSPIVIVESAILCSCELKNKVDKILVVVAEKETRIKRVMKRSNLTRNEVLSRIQHQISENELVKMSDFIVQNNPDQLLIPQIETIISSLIKP